MRAILLAFAFLAGPAAADFTGRVVNVDDGDTITVLVDQHQIRVRLVDIDAPELGQAFGRDSRDSLSRICAGLSARVSEHGQDHYGRTLGRVTCGVVDANAEQVRRGMAWVYVRDAPRGAGLYQLQTAAQLESRGLWADVHPVAPWEWRRFHRVSVQPES